ncbi:hypothetical protein [Desertihabitans aurantiacus]|uniref:hypothetical protein n=1 Tax=Desertihabitans aurantiacus TaxID=2282477 RepID=UPI000DF7DBB8|nr:hypothetical protein [Desertihabitans aurantiacus]
MALAVLLCPRGPLEGVGDVLRDWNALGLVEDFVLVDAGEPGGAADRSLLVSAGLARPVRVDELVARTEPDRVRLAVLVPALPDPCGDDEHLDARAEELRGSVAGQRGPALELLRVVLCRPGGEDALAGQVRGQWHTLVVSPEDSRAPGSPSQQLDERTDPVGIGPHAAAALCGLLGLWRGQPGAPYDGTSSSPVPRARVVRTFHRRLDLGGAAAQVRERVLPGGGSFPLPWDGDQVAVTVPADSVRQVTEETARRWASAHPLWSGREEVPEPRTEHVGPVEALRLFLGFLASAVRGAPERWARAVRHQVASQVAARVHAAVFGQADSAYTVVVRGVRPDGSPAGLEDLTRAAAQLSEVRLPDQPVSVPAPVRVSQLWRDFLGAAMTLLDAGERHPTLKPVAAGHQRAVLARTEDVVPPLDAVEDGLHPADHLGVEMRLRQLRVVEGGAPVERIQQLEHWRERWADSFATACGRELGAKVVESSREVRQILLALEEARGEVADDPAAGRGQRSLGRRLLGMAGVTLLLSVLAVVLGAYGVLDVATTAIVVLVLVVGFAVGGSVVFVRHQQELFQALARQRSLVRAADVHRQNLPRAVEDLRVRTELYGQLRRWVDVLARFLAPTGEPASGPGQGPTDGVTFPLSVQLGASAPDVDQVDLAAQRVQRATFGRGWLDRGFAGFLEHGARTSGELHQRTVDPDYLLSEGAEPGTALSRWAAADPATLPGAWAWVHRTVEAAVQEETTRLSASAPVVSGGRVRSHDEFVGEADLSGADRALAQRCFTPVAVGAGANLVEPPVWSVSFGLARTVVEHTRWLAADELAGRPVAGSARPVPDDDVEF